MCSALSSVVSQRIIPDEKIINFSTEETPLRDVLFELSAQTDVVIAFQDQIIPADSIVSLSIRKERLGKIIDYLIKPHKLKYKIIGNQIVITRDQYQKKKESDSDYVTVSGTVRDVETGEAMVNAHIYLGQNKSVGTSSNEYGFYSLTLPRGLYELNVSYVGFEDGIVEVALARDTIVDIELLQKTRLKDIIIAEKSLIPLDDKNEPPIESIDILPIEKIISFLPLAGEPDVMRLAYSGTGVTTGADGFGGMSVRGGETNQNLVLFDGIPVYNAQHGFGLFSIFNSSVIKSATLYKGAFPAHYSGRLSSVLDIRTREGSVRDFRGDVSIGLISATASLEGPIIKEKSSFLLSFRRTIVDTWTKSASRVLFDNNGSLSLYFLDFNAKVNYQLGRNSKLYFSYYKGKDNFNIDILDPEDQAPFYVEDYDQVYWDSGNSLMSMRWNTRVSQKSFLNVSLYRSRYIFESFEQDRMEYYDLVNRDDVIDIFFDAGYYVSGITDVGMRTNFDFIPNPKHRFKFGLGYLRHKFTPGFTSVTVGDSLVPREQVLTIEDTRESLVNPTLESSELEFYVEDQIRLGEKSRLNLGYNHTIISTGAKSYHIPQPRISFTSGSTDSYFKASAGRMGQFLHTLTNTGLGVPIDVWLPTTDALAPETSMTLTAGQFKRVKNVGMLGLEAFYKRYNNITRFSETGFIEISTDSDWESLVPVGTGKSYGMELSLEKQSTKLNYKLGYTLSWSFRQFDDINEGEQFAFRYDRRHIINFNTVYKLSENFDVSLNWEFGSGNPITLPDNQFYRDIGPDGLVTTVLIFDEINNATLPDYHRLDLGFNMYSQHKWGKSTFTLGLYNAYDRRNPLYRDIKIDPNSLTNIMFQDVTIIPILPTFRYAVSF